MIEETFKSTLGSLFTNGLWPNVAKDDPAAPYAVYAVTTATPEWSFAGFAGLTTSLFQLDIYASTYAAAKTLAASVRTALAATSLQYQEIASRDLYEDDTKLHRVLMEIAIAH